MESGATPFSWMSQAMRAGDDAGFAGACAGQDEQGSFSGLDGGSLFGIQVVSERVQGGVRREGSCIQCTGLGGTRMAWTGELEC
jgi:hypothetical protein